MCDNCPKLIEIINSIMFQCGFHGILFSKELKNKIKRLPVASGKEEAHG